MICYIIEIDFLNIINVLEDNYLQNILKCTSNCTLHRNCATNFEKDHVFTTLSPKFLFEKTQNACSPILVHLCHILFAFCKKN